MPLTPKNRCEWAGTDPLYVEYHDTEWGVPVHDDRKLFEFLILEGAQAGLSWITILRKRENYRKAFAGFDPLKVSRFGKAKIKSLLKNPGIIRNKLKVQAAVTNAKAFLQVQRDHGSFDAFFWSFVGGKHVVNAWRETKRVPPRTDASDAIAKELKRRGFKFAGSTIMYAHMQACGLVNDHLTTCFRYREV